MKRIKVLIGKRRVMVIATLAILVLAAAALVASSASFTASTSNGPNVFTSGTLIKPGVSPGTALFTLNGMKPGDVSAPQDATVTNPAGNVSAKMYLSAALDSDPKYSVNFAKDLLLTVVEDPGTANERTLVPGLPLDTALATRIPVNNGAAWAAGEPHVYRFSVLFKDNGEGVDNGLQNAQTSVSFSWTAVSGN
jgi:spore coat-associated protein N